MTAAVAAAATAATAAEEEDTTGFQHQSQDQDPAKQPAQKKLRKKGPSSAQSQPTPPSPSVSPTNTEPPLSDSKEDKDLAEEDVTGRRKKASITQMLDENQEAELADWWKEHLGLYDKSNETYRRKEKRDRLIAEKAREMGCRASMPRCLLGR